MPDAQKPPSVKQTTIRFHWWVFRRRLRFRNDTHRVTFHNDYIAVGRIDKHGDEKARTWYPWHTIRHGEEKWL